MSLRSIVHFFVFSIFRLFTRVRCPICYLNPPDIQLDPTLHDRQGHEDLIRVWGRFWHRRCPNENPEFGPCCHVKGHMHRHFTAARGGWSWA